LLFALAVLDHRPTIGAFPRRWDDIYHATVSAIVNMTSHEHSAQTVLELHPPGLCLPGS
jgi:hypothetical protein